MSYFEDWIEPYIGEERFLHEENEWAAYVEGSLVKWSNEELLVDTRKILHEHPPEDKEYLDKIRSIFIQGVARQSLSDKQRYVLADFVLSNT